MTMKLTRRLLLAAGVAALLAALKPGRLLARHRSRAGGAARTPTGDQLAAAFTDLDAPREVGRRYLRADPLEASPERVQAFLDEFSDLGSPEALRQDLARLRDRDFRVQDIVFIDGWVLARSEARLCALTVLL